MKRIVIFSLAATAAFAQADAAVAGKSEALSAPMRELLSARLCGNAGVAAAAAAELERDYGDSDVACKLLEVYWGDEAVRTGVAGERREEAAGRRDYYRSLAADRIRVRMRRGDPLAAYLVSLGSTNAASRMRSLRAPAAADIPWALADLGSLLLADQYRRGRPREQRLRECHNLFAAAARQNEPTGLFSLGLCRLRGIGCQADDKAAFQLFQRAVEPPCEHPLAFALLGECYRDGRGVERDGMAALRCFQKSASLDCPEGVYAYACALRDGIGATTNDLAAARTQFVRAAVAGLPEAMVAAGDVLAAEGAEGEQAAFGWYRRAAVEARYPPAMDRTGDCLLHGRGVATNETAAVCWFYHAAWHCDSVDAMNHLAECCDQGLGGLERSHAHANWWRTRARAVQGDRNALVWLGMNEPDLFAPSRLGAPWTGGAAP